jgi:methionine sulfoxide reductase heme-binding subunit
VPSASPLNIRRLKPVVFVAGLGPCAYLLWAIFTDNLSANPVADITAETGTWALRFLTLTLAVTPVRRLTGWNDIIRIRRMLGLFGFFYACLHFLTYLVLDHFFYVPDIVADIAKRPFVTVGFTAFVLMIPLALTSTAASIRRLGGRRWQRVHRLVYVSAVAGVVHYWWLVKADVRRPMIYGLIVGTLLLFRVAWSLTRRAPAPVGSRARGPATG